MVASLMVHVLIRAHSGDLNYEKHDVKGGVGKAYA
jgi:copper homeostasis protein CutC